MQTASSSIRTCVPEFISYDDNNYITRASLDIYQNALFSHMLNLKHIFNFSQATLNPYITKNPHIVRIWSHFH